MKKQLVFESMPPEDPGLFILTRDDLEDPELALYDAVMHRLTDPTGEQKRMAAAFAFASAELQKAGDPALGEWLRRCMIFARNGLKLWQVESVLYTDLLLDACLPGRNNWPPVIAFLDDSWQK